MAQKSDQQAKFLRKFLKFLETVSGRDKLARTAQYVCKVLGQHSVPDSAKRLQVLETNLSQGRMVFRLFRSITSFHTALRSFYTERDPIVRTTTVSKELCSVVWLVYDHISFLGRIGTLSVDLPRLSRRTNQFWLFSCIMDIIKSLHQLRLAQAAAEQAKKEDASADLFAQIQRRRTELYLVIMRSFLDGRLALAGVSSRFPLTPVRTGWYGLVSSLIMTYEAWKKVPS